MSNQATRICPICKQPTDDRALKSLVPLNDANTGLTMLMHPECVESLNTQYTQATRPSPVQKAPPVDDTRMKALYKEFGELDEATRQAEYQTFVSKHLSRREQE